MTSRHGSDYQTCPVCNGTGKVECEDCKGTGEITYPDKILDETFRCDACRGTGKVNCIFDGCRQGYIPRL